MLSLWYLIFINYISVYNPDRTLHFKVPTSGYSANWSQLAPDGNKLRMVYAPNLDTTKAVELAFELLEKEVSPELNMIDYSKLLQDEMVGNFERANNMTLISGDGLPNETTVSGYRAIQYDNVLKDAETDENYHLVIIFAEQEKHYLLIDILCKEEDYSSDRDAPYWKVIDTINEIVKT